MSGYKHSGFSREEYLGKVGYEAYCQHLDENMDDMPPSFSWPDWERIDPVAAGGWVAAAAAIESEAQ